MGPKCPPDHEQRKVKLSNGFLQVFHRFCNGGVAGEKTCRKLEVENWQKTGDAAEEETGGKLDAQSGRKLEASLGRELVKKLAVGYWQKTGNGLY